MKRARWFLTAVLLAGAVSLPLSAGAASGRCANPMTRLEQMELVVHARILAVPQPGVAELDVQRYHRGSGPASMTVRFEGGGSLEALAPVAGADMLIELMQDEQGYFVSPCALFKPYAPALTEVQQALEVLGPGTAPIAETPAPPPGDPASPPAEAPAGPSWLCLGLLVAGMAALGGVGGWWLARRRTQE